MTYRWRCFEEATNLVPILKHLNCMVGLHQYKSMASGINHKHQKPQNWEVKLLSSSWTGCAYTKSPPESEARGYRPARCALARADAASLWAGKEATPRCCLFLLRRPAAPRLSSGVSSLCFSIFCFPLWKRLWTQPHLLKVRSKKNKECSQHLGYCNFRQWQEGVRRTLVLVQVRGE